MPPRAPRRCRTQTPGSSKAMVYPRSLPPVGTLAPSPSMRSRREAGSAREVCAEQDAHVPSPTGRTAVAGRNQTSSQETRESLPGQTEQPREEPQMLAGADPQDSSLAPARSPRCEPPHGSARWRSPYSRHPRTDAHAKSRQTGRAETRLSRGQGVSENPSWRPGCANTCLTACSLWEKLLFAGFANFNIAHVADEMA